MNSTALFLDHQSSLTYWFTIFGSFFAFILTILKIDEIIKNRIMLKIDVKEAYFVSKPSNLCGEPDRTRLDIVLDIRNEGRQPTTISGIDFYSNITNFSDFMLYNEISSSASGKIRMPSFEPIEVKANYRIEKKIFTEKMIYLENLNEFDCTLNIKTAHKTIVQKVNVLKI